MLMNTSTTVVVAILCGRAGALAWRLPFKMATAVDQKNVRFVTNTKCPYAQRTWIALEESGTPYEMSEISLYGSGGKPNWFMDLNPKGEVPVLVVDGLPIVGSEETVDFLMQGTLNPESARAISSRWRALVNERLKTAGKRAVFSGGTEGHQASLDAVLQELESCLACGQGDQTTGGNGDSDSGNDGPFVCGESFTAADASAFPFLQRIHGEFGFPADCTRLEAWYNAARRRPGVKKTVKKDFWWWW